jgi:putative membrane protein
MMNQVSEIYGLHLGYWGTVKLMRKIFHTMLYAGAAEILSDAGNYALGAGITGKLSTRVAQGMGAGVLTARIGLKAMNESRPLPWLLEAKPGLSGISKQLLADLNKHL